MRMQSARGGVARYSSDHPEGSRMPDLHSPPVFTTPYAPDDSALIRPLLALAGLAAAAEARVDAEARVLIEAVRSRGGLGGVEQVLRQYALDTREGLALMVLAEALLRIPDPVTADRLIEDKLGSADFGHPAPEGSRPPVNPS